MKIDVISFTQTLSSLLKSNLTLQSSLQIASEIDSNKKNKEFCKLLYNRVTEGFNLSNLLSSYESIFSPLYLSIVRLGEKSGTLIEVFEKLSSYLKTRKATKDKIIQSLIYPILVLISALVVVFVIMFFVFPQLEQIFEAFSDSSLDVSLQISKIRQNMMIITYILFALIVSIILLFWVHKKNERCAYYIDCFLIHLPLVKKYVIINQTMDFAFAMKLMSASHFPFSEGINQSIQVLTNRRYKLGMINIYKEIINGNNIGESFERQKILPSYLVTWIKISEINGDTEGVFSQIYEYYSNENSNIISGIAVTAEPVFIILTGIIVLFLIGQFVIPIFKLLGTL